MPEPVLALSLRQPWAWLVVHGGKRLENRRWYRRDFPRSPILIQAAKAMTRREYHDGVAFACRAAPGVVVPPFDELPRGVIVGRCRIVDVQDNDRVPGHPWAMSGQFGYHLVDVEPLPLIACKGMLGFFRVPPDVLAALGLEERRAQP